MIYQKDDLNHEWNLREGWGDVREIYVTPSHRRAGFGKALLLAAECDMKGLGVDKERKQRIVFADAYVIAGFEFGAALSYENVSRKHELTN